MENVAGYKMTKGETVAMWMIAIGVVSFGFGALYVFAIDITGMQISASRNSTDAWYRFLCTQRYGNAYLGIFLVGLGALINWRIEDRKG